METNPVQTIFSIMDDIHAARERLVSARDKLNAVERSLRDIPACACFRCQEDDCCEGRVYGTGKPAENVQEGR